MQIVICWNNEIKHSIDILFIFQYYDEQFPTAKEQKQFEKNLFGKTHKANCKDNLLHVCTFSESDNCFSYKSLIDI